MQNNVVLNKIFIRFLKEKNTDYLSLRFLLKNFNSRLSLKTINDFNQLILFSSHYKGFNYFINTYIKINFNITKIFINFLNNNFSVQNFIDELYKCNSKINDLDKIYINEYIFSMISLTTSNLELSRKWNQFLLNLILYGKK